MKFDYDKFNECFDGVATPMVLRGGVPIVTRVGALVIVKRYLNMMQDTNQLEKDKIMALCKVCGFETGVCLCQKPAGRCKKCHIRFAIQDDLCEGCWPKENEPNCSEPDLPTVAGRHLRGSFSEFEQACLTHIQRLQENIGDYDCAMLDTFCEAVRMVREYSVVMQVRTDNIRNGGIHGHGHI